MTLLDLYKIIAKDRKFISIYYGTDKQYTDIVKLDSEENVAVDFKNKCLVIYGTHEQFTLELEKYEITWKI